MMRRFPRATWIAVSVTGILTMLLSLLGNVGATALTWLSPPLALVLFVLISLALIAFSLWQAGQKSASDGSEADFCPACQRENAMRANEMSTKSTRASGGESQVRAVAPTFPSRLRSIVRMPVTLTAIQVARGNRRIIFPGFHRAGNDYRTLSVLIIA